MRGQQAQTFHIRLGQRRGGFVEAEADIAEHRGIAGQCYADLVDQPLRPNPLFIEAVAVPYIRAGDLGLEDRLLER